MDIQDKIEHSDNNPYDSWAYYYDMDSTQKPSIDVKFYLKVISQFDEVLELCCGTGRITIALAQNNIRVTALDISKEMLAILRRKLEANSNIVERIKLVNANMINFNLNKKFDCILIPFHSFLSLTNMNHIWEALKNVYNHLSDNGLFILNIFKPIENMKDLEGEIETETVRDSIGLIYEKRCINTFVDTKNQIVYYRLEYHLFDKGGKKCVVRKELQTKYYYSYQIEKILKDMGFEIISIHAGFDANANDANSSELTLICKKMDSQNPTTASSASSASLLMKLA